MGLLLIYAVTVAFSLITPSACTGSLSPVGEVHICLGQPQTFSCTVHRQASHSLLYLEWRIDFEDSQSVSKVSRQFTTADVEGEILQAERTGVNFTFNLTSISLTSLVSVMTVATNISASTVINNATIHCGNEPTPHAVLLVQRGPPHAKRLMNMTQHGVMPLVTNFTNGTLTKIQWNKVDDFETIIIDFDPTVNSESTFTITTNNSIQVFLLYNQTYNIRLIASNCAGNSTPEEVNITIVPYCDFSNSSGSDDILSLESKISEVIQTNNFYCRCANDTSWSLATNKFQCNIQAIAKTTSSGTQGEDGSKIEVWHTIVASVVTLSAVLLIAVAIVVSMVKVYRGEHHKRAAVDQHNYYSDIPTSHMNNQGLGIYSALQSEENIQRITRVQSTDERREPVYADIGCTPSLNTNTTTISLPPGDVHVEYVAIKQLSETSHNDNDSGVQTDIPVNLDTLLIHLRAELTPKWKEFGLIVGIEEDVLKLYSSHPPGECIVEVLDYWLRNCHEESKPTWKKIANILKEIGLDQLAENIQYNDIGIAQLQVDTNHESEFDFQFVSSEEVPPPLPPKIVNLDEEMKIRSSFPSALGVEHQLESGEALQCHDMLSESSGNSCIVAPPIPPKNYMQH